MQLGLFLLLSLQVITTVPRKVRAVPHEADWLVNSLTFAVSASHRVSVVTATGTGTVAVMTTDMSLIWPEMVILLVSLINVVCCSCTGHMVKNGGAVQSKACVNITADRRWVCTGTPLNNDITDLLGQFAVLQMQPFGTKSFFDSRIKPAFVCEWTSSGFVTTSPGCGDVACADWPRATCYACTPYSTSAERQPEYMCQHMHALGVDGLLYLVGFCLALASMCGPQQGSVRCEPWLFSPLLAEEGPLLRPIQSC